MNEMLHAQPSPGRPLWTPVRDWRRLLIGIIALVALAIEKQGEQLLEMERLLGPWSISDLNN